MKLTFLNLTFILFSISAFSQGLTEDQIPFTLNSDMDTEINVIDADDDNDGVLDNLDVFPLDANLSTSTILIDTIRASDDAGLRNNNSNGANNYDAVAEMKGSLRSFMMKFEASTESNLNAATLTFYSDDEDDPLQVYFVPFSSWDESTVTFNTTDLSGEIYLGMTGVPTGTVGDYTYTFDIPIGILPSSGEYSIRIVEPNNDGKEYLHTKEAAGIAPAKVEYSFTVVPEDRVLVAVQSMTEYILGGPFIIDVELTQMPLSSVYVPFQLSSPNAQFDIDEVLVFDDSNWDTPQSIMIAPVDIGDFDVYVRPLHSDDPYFNGNNPEDIPDFLIQAADITNLGGWSVATGDTLQIGLLAESGVGSNDLKFKVLEGPSGLNVKESSGLISFRPLSSQIGLHGITLQVTDDFGNVSLFETIVTVIDGGAPDPIGVILDFNAADDMLADGSAAHPFNDLVMATDYAAANGGGDVLIRGVEYMLPGRIGITTAASEAAPVTIRPMDGENVKFNFEGLSGFDFDETSRYLTFEGFEIDGNTDGVDFWCVVGQALWGDPSISRGGGQAVIIDGQWITIRNNYIHDAYQKAVEIRDARYAKIYGNIIEKIATSSLSGGHGIMRQQKGDEFFDDDIAGEHRWDIKGNVLFNVEQRIYSWVPSKGFLEMTLDEGKPILIDDPKDTDGSQEQMSARIKDNVIAFGSIDGIRLKSTPNLQVSNNSIYSNSIHADGITDKGGDTDTPQFINFIGTNNAVQTAPGTTAIEIDDCIEQTESNGGVPIVSGNIAAVGSVKPTSYPGLETNSTTQLFVDGNNGNFAINPTLGLPSTLGVDPSVLDSLSDRAGEFGVTIQWDGWTNDDLKLTQTILDNIPGINDGVAGNDTVFTNAGVLNAARNHLDFDVVVGGAWQMEEEAPDTMQFRLNESYIDWYHEVELTYSGYDRLRWGCSYAKQNQVFQENWLVHSQITTDTNTVIYGVGYDFVMDGDLLVDFEGVTPETGDYYDLMIADNITSASVENVFDNVFFEGYTPSDYSIEIVDIAGGQAVRLTILGCTMVTNTEDSGPGSLREAIACVDDGGTVTISASLEGDTIKLTSLQLIIDKNVTIISERPTIYVQNCTAESAIVIASSRVVLMNGFQVLSDQVVNNGDLTCVDMVFKRKNSNGTVSFVNMPGAILNATSQVNIE